MNLTYRLIWDAVTNGYVSATTFTRNGKIELRIVRIAYLSTLPLFTPAAYAAPVPTELPSGGQVTAGQASIAVDGSHMDVNQASQNASLNWQTFNIGQNAQVDFHQPNASAVAVNRIADPNGSQIMGRLNANGQIYLINPNGVLFGQGSQVNVGGLVASTLDISDADAASGKRTFSSKANGGEGKIVNQGTITAADGGYVALLGGQVSNQGIIQARLGTVALAAGDKISLDFAGDKLLNVEVDKGALQALAENKQLIQADGGIVLMTAKAADTLLAGVVNNEGVIEARTVDEHNGVIKLLGDMDSGTVNVGGTLDASVRPSPTGRGAGGEGEENGGFIETSAAHVKIADGAKITTAAPNGHAGTWLIDPYDFTIAASGGDITGTALTAALGVGAVTIQTALGSVTCTGATCGAGNAAGNGDIFVNDAVSWSANLLTLSAYRNIAINANLNGSGTAQLALEYGQGAANAGNTSTYTLSNGAQVSLPAGPNFSTKLGNNVAATTYTVITSLGTSASSNDGTLQGMGGALAGNYALGANIDAGGTATWNGGTGFVPVGRINLLSGVPNAPFTGKFDGLGHTISNLFIDRNVNEGVGLFGNTNGAALQNVGLLNVNLKGGTDGTGALVGWANGATVIRNSYADGGSVKAYSHRVGGLVGTNTGASSISYSYANVSVESSDGGFATDAFAGGLVGSNGGSISYSYATGSVTGKASDPADNKGIGGLVGLQTNSGSISNSYATGAVSAKDPVTNLPVGGTNLGGLIGEVNGGGGSVTSSYWDKDTTGQGNSANVTGGGGGDGTGLTTAEWSTLGPFGTAPSGGAWLAADWGSGNPYPGIKTLPYITITASASQTYGSAATFGIASILDQTGANATGLVNTGGLSWTASTSPASAAGTTSAVRGAGATGTGPGYQILYVGNLTVDKAPLTVTANGFSKTYDGLAYSGGNGVGYSGFVNGEGSGVLGGTLAYGGSSQSAVNVGSYAITPSGLTSGNYDFSYVNGSLTVNPAALTVTANGFSKIYDGLAYSGGNGVSYSGFVNGEGSGVLGGALAYGGSSQNAVNTGSYAITPSGLTSSNYTISYANGALTINAAPLIVTTSNPALTLNDSRLVKNSVAQLESTILLPPTNIKPVTSDSSPSNTVAQSSSAGTDDESTPESATDTVQNNTNLSSRENGSTFTIVHPGVKLPDNMLNVDE
ncbi:filamentous hemagglutinin N-terminal domain-containing protein [Methylobacter sp.]|uniref:two-partner secretion domain-containing protein n=1 Tax=Methylobacter sp. TaxID=2051955 RepID=UPI00121E58C3|nr:filamentous hemagglutinin N-terminal domain-containing protein [Methylobacter sp.]TAK64175.1 MAG: filamentous hemagglutinin N-terminal domain-containing protein [Methylobacter sp.]